MPCSPSRVAWTHTRWSGWGGLSCWGRQFPIPLAEDDGKLVNPTRVCGIGDGVLVEAVGMGADVSPHPVVLTPQHGGTGIPPARCASKPPCWRDLHFSGGIKWHGHT